MDFFNKQKDALVQKVGESAITHVTGGAVDGKTVDSKYTKAIGGKIVETSVNNKETIGKIALESAKKH